MRERPLLFSAPMVNAILAGRKTQTRRVVKPGLSQAWLTSRTIGEVRRFEHRQDGWWAMVVGDPMRIVHCGVEIDGGHIGSVRCPYGVPGDRLWVRESWRTHERPVDGVDGVLFQADDGFQMIENTREASEAWVCQHNAPSSARGTKWRPSIHMPRWASRLTLEITGLRVERLQDISEEDARAEGVEADDISKMGVPCYSARQRFEQLWSSINGPESWDANPWVWVVSFRRVEQGNHITEAERLEGRG